MTEKACGCIVQYPPGLVHFCPKHAAVDGLIAALEECAKHIVALTSLGPGDINIDAARASAAAAQAAIRKTQS